MQIPTDAALLRRGRVLLGFMSLDEAQAYVTSQCAVPFDEVRGQWAAARDAVAALDPIEGPLPPPEIRDLPPELGPRAGVITAGQVFQTIYAPMRAEFALVEVDRLVAFQQFIDTQFAEESAPPQLDSVAAQFDYCIPQDHSANMSIAPDPPGRAVTITSLSRNINLAGLSVVQQPDQPLQVAFLIAVQPNWVQVAEFEGRYFLKNGYHRVWRLRQLGVTHVPAVLTRAASLDDVGAGPGFFPAAVILSERPPLFQHFSDDALAAEMELKSTMKVIRLSGAEFVVARLP